MPVLKSILAIAELCAQKRVRHVVICPGSRSAALTLAFARHPNIKTYVIPDERVGGFVALGMAQQLNHTVAVVCTSGSAAYNLSPAIAEAYFQQIPMLIFTADRPAEWINQNDGQTIYQQEIYGRHVKASLELPSDYTHPDSNWHIERSVNHAINLSLTPPCAPVHINVPIREPFYPTSAEEWEYPVVKRIDNEEIENNLSIANWHKILNKWDCYDRVMIAIGQQDVNDELSKTLHHLSSEYAIPIIGDVISNVTNANFIHHHDTFLLGMSAPEAQQFCPELLITVGKSFISKALKLFLRNNKPIEHWHIEINDETIDPFQTLTKKLNVSPTYFFKKLAEDLDFQAFRSGEEETKDENYLHFWQTAEEKAKKNLHQFLNSLPNFCEFVAVREVLEALPKDQILHLANSMIVRYANYLTVNGLEVFCNRGTSGIDGCTSTAVGAALQTDKLVFLLTGDVAFFYDRNALWHQHLPPNLRIVLFNNFGGTIFRLIDGPSKLPELEEFFETRHQTTAQLLAQEFKLTYNCINDLNSLLQLLPDFVSTNGGPKLIEIQTDPVLNGKVFEEFKATMKR